MNDFCVKTLPQILSMNTCKVTEWHPTSYKINAKMKTQWYVYIISALVSLTSETEPSYSSLTAPDVSSDSRTVDETRMRV